LPPPHSSTSLSMHEHSSRTTRLCPEYHRTLCGVAGYLLNCTPYARKPPYQDPAAAPQGFCRRRASRFHCTRYIVVRQGRLKKQEALARKGGSVGNKRLTCITETYPWKTKSALAHRSGRASVLQQWTLSCPAGRKAKRRSV